MIAATLLPHPSTPASAARAIAVEVGAADGGLVLAFCLAADRGALRIPPPAPAAAADGLWRHTCFEAFAALDGQQAYREFNFSPSGQWAAYAFRAWRMPEPDAPNLPLLPQIAVDRTAGRLGLTARIPAAALPPRAPGVTLRLGLTAVVEADDGALSYWALAHPDGLPDFHHRDGFVMALDWTPPVA